MIGLATIDHKATGPAILLEGVTQNSLSGGEIAPLAGPEPDYVTMNVDAAIQIRH